jgi:hypothetical protein
MVSAGTSKIWDTFFVFCAVNAVIAVQPYTPSAENVFRSACTPAPAPESLPAMESATFN